MGAVTWTAYNTADDIGGTAFNSLADGSGRSPVRGGQLQWPVLRLPTLRVTQGALSPVGPRCPSTCTCPTYDGTKLPDPGGATTFTGTQYVGVISSVERSAMVA